MRVIHKFTASVDTGRRPSSRRGRKGLSPLQSLAAGEVVENLLPVENPLVRPPRRGGHGADEIGQPQRLILFPIHKQGGRIAGVEGVPRGRGRKFGC